MDGREHWKELVIRWCRQEEVAWWDVPELEWQRGLAEGLTAGEMYERARFLASAAHPPQGARERFGNVVARVRWAIEHETADLDHLDAVQDADFGAWLEVRDRTRQRVADALTGAGLSPQTFLREVERRTGGKRYAYRQGLTEIVALYADGCAPRYGWRFLGDVLPAA